VTHVDAAQGITLRLLGKRAGETFVLPPDLDALHPAQPGSYRLRQTGEIVVDPDFVTTWVSSHDKPNAPPAKPVVH
jgi:hypothetical protein